MAGNLIAVLTPLPPTIHEKLSQLGELKCCFEGTKEEAIKIAKDCNIIFTNPNMQGYKIDEEFRTSELKYIATASTGTNHITIKDIPVISLTKEMNTIKKISSTAELAFALMLCLIRKIMPAYDSVLMGDWNHLPFVGQQLNSLKIGIIGYGRLGNMFAKYCRAFDAEIVIYDPFEGFDEIEKLYSCDVISLHVHLKEDTKHMINQEFLNKLTNQPYIINTSRGEIVDELAIQECLVNGKISGYGADVLSNELKEKVTSPLIDLAKEGYNVVLTPHIGGMTVRAREIAYSRTVEILKEKLNEN